MDNVLMQMQKIVEKNVKHYKTDFYTYDCQTYGRMYDNDRFIWITRECGTNICGIYKDIQNEERQKDVKDIAQCYFEYFAITNRESLQCQFYLVTKGKSVVKINTEDFEKLVK